MSYIILDDASLFVFVNGCAGGFRNEAILTLPIDQQCMSILFMAKIKIHTQNRRKAKKIHTGRFELGPQISKEITCGQRATGVSGSFGSYFLTRRKFFADGLIKFISWRKVSAGEFNGCP